MSTLKVGTIQNASGVEVYTAKAWVNFNGTGTVAIRASGNVSSITDNGAGDYTVNFTTAIVDANYSAAVSVKQDANAAPSSSISCPAIYTNSSFRFICVEASVSVRDMSTVNVAIFR